jgi:anti-sigma factor RsiW
MDSDQEKQMVQYLLGQLSEQEQAELERLYLTDDALFEQLLAIEDELRDTYARGELSSADRQAFEQRLLILPRQKEKQKFARMLRQHLMQVGAPASPVAQPVAKWKSLFRILEAKRRIIFIPAVSALLVVLVVGSWWLIRRSMQSSLNGPGAASRAKGLQSQEPKPQPQAPTHAPEPEANTVAFVLTPGSTRGGAQESSPLVIPAGVSQVRLEARVEGDYTSYEVVLQTAESKSIWRRGDVKAQVSPEGKKIVLDVPSTLLATGDFILTLRGLPASGSPEIVAEYAFRVSKR